MIKTITIIFLLSISNMIAQSIELRIKDYIGKVYFSNAIGDITTLLDSVNINYDTQLLLNKKLKSGLNRISFTHNKWIDFVNDGKDVKISTDVKYVLDSLKVIESESNKLFYTFLRLNKTYKIKTELLQLIIARFPQDDIYYKETKKRLNELQSEYLQFVNITTQEDPTAFVAKYIQSSQLPVIDSDIPLEKQIDYLKSHALDYVNFSDASLINSDLFTNKTIEYLTYFRNPQLPKELLEKEFMKTVDSLLNKAKVNQVVYQHITEYLIDGFKKFGFDQVLDYIVENYVIKDDLCLDVKTEGLIKRRIEHAKLFKIGATVPNIILPELNRKQIDLSKITTEKILIVFYASWCPHCKELLPQLNELKKNKGNKLEVLAISLDNKKEEWTNFVKNHCSLLINVSDLQGWDGKTSNDYYIYATPTMFLINTDSKIIGIPKSFEQIKSSL